MRNKQITFLLDTIIVNRQHSYTMNLFSILRYAPKARIAKLPPVSIPCALQWRFRFIT
jgi:hypothetical protein